MPSIYFLFHSVLLNNYFYILPYKPSLRHASVFQTIDITPTLQEAHRYIQGHYDVPIKSASSIQGAK